MYDVGWRMEDGGWRMSSFLITAYIIKFFTSVSQQFYKFFAIVMETFELNVCEIVIAVKQFQPTQALTLSSSVTTLQCSCEHGIVLAAPSLHAPLSRQYRTSI